MGKKFYRSCAYGNSHRDNKRFDDSSFFGDDGWKNAILKKIKLWYGTPKSDYYFDKYDVHKDKCILGIQCEYQDLLSGKITIITEQHWGDLNGEDVEAKELSLKDNDYFTNVKINFDHKINYLKFITKKGEILEFGVEKEETSFEILSNMFRAPMLHSFFGSYNIYGLQMLGCNYISRKDFIVIKNIGIGISMLRIFFNNNEKEKQKWENHKELNKLSYEMKAIAKLSLLPDKVFRSVLRNISKYINIIGAIFYYLFIYYIIIILIYFFIIIVGNKTNIIFIYSLLILFI